MLICELATALFSQESSAEWVGCARKLPGIQRHVVSSQQVESINVYQLFICCVYMFNAAALSVSLGTPLEPLISLFRTVERNCVALVELVLHGPMGESSACRYLVLSFSISSSDLFHFDLVCWATSNSATILRLIQLMASH